MHFPQHKRFPLPQGSLICYRWFMKEETCKAIVLRSTAYQEKARILTVFSEEKGILSVMVKNVTQQKSAMLSPFCELEFVFYKKNSDMVSFKEGKIINDHLFLREKLEFLQTASSMTRAILKSQMPGKHAPLLYQLLRAYLKQIPLFSSHNSLLGSYYLKILQHEGLFLEGHSFDEEEQTWIQKLGEIQKFSQLTNAMLPISLLQKIQLYFEEKMR